METNARVEEKLPPLRIETAAELLKNLAARYAKSFTWALALNILFVLLEMCQPLLVAKLLGEIELGPALQLPVALITALAMGTLAFINVFALQHGFHFASTLCVKIR